MASLRSRAFVFVLKHRHLLQGRLKRRKIVDWNTCIPKLREDIERGASGLLGKLPAEMVLEPFSIGSLGAEWMLPPGGRRDRAILYLHGGGLVVGSIKAHRGIVAKFVKGSGVPALVIDYRLAPEHPFPQGLEDCVSAYRYLLEQKIDPARIIVMGDSGGGNLVFATLLALKQQGLALPGGAVALSPWVDLTNSGESWETNRKRDTLGWKEAQNVFSKYYAGDNDLKNPLVSPLFGDLQGFPPLLLYAGGDETLLSDSVRIARKAQEAGVDVTLKVGKGLFHCYPACAPLFPEASQAMEQICAFIGSHLAKS